MKCGEPKPGDSWRSCEKNLKHPGGHKYLNDTWPRPVPNDADPDVESLLDETRPANAWGLDERSFPIVVTETVTRIIWVDAENEDDALAYYADDYSDIDLKGTEVLDGYLEFERPDADQLQEAFRLNSGEPRVGPQIACPDCRQMSFRQVWFHDPYRKCHGPIVWKTSGLRRPMREHQQNPAFDAARQAVTA